MRLAIDESPIQDKQQAQLTNLNVNYDQKSRYKFYKHLTTKSKWHQRKLGESLNSIRKNIN